MAYGTVHLLLFNMHSLIFNHFGSGKDCLSILSVEFSLLFTFYEELCFLFGIILQGELGANAILAVSIAACKAGAAEKEVFLFEFFMVIT